MTANWFYEGGSNYAKFRPEYPDGLAVVLAELVPETTFALDIGCGTGQFTTSLADYFDYVLGTDPSADQIANAKACEGVTYDVSPAEEIPVADGEVDLITAAQAAHWFDLPRFYEEVRRVSKPDAVLALISYGTPSVSEGLDARFKTFYWDEIGPYWPAERKLVDDGYRTIEFPFDEVEVSSVSIEKELNLAEFLGYISTWSAVASARKAGAIDVLEKFTAEFSALWGEPNRRVKVTWPINIRAGRVQ